jgi:anaerobic dimethyl sulfoxide reductase subunit B (iron-sulfur subunit)
MGRLGFYYDQSMCIGCRACQVTCKDMHDLPIGKFYRLVTTYETGVYPDGGRYHYSGACNHCENPACVAACPVGAMHVAEDGTVLPDPDTCIGCQACVSACPYGAPQYFEDKGITSKCDACADRRAQGLEPMCVAACVTRCLFFGDLDELAAEHGEDAVDELPCLPSASQTGPSVLIAATDFALEEEFRQVSL